MKSQSLRSNNESSRSRDEVARQKIGLARMTGLPPNDEYDLTDDVPFAAAPDLSLDDALKQAFERRADIKAAEAQIHAAEHALAAARDERLPALSVSGNYGAIGTNPSQIQTTYFGDGPSMFQFGWEVARGAISRRRRLSWPSGKPNSKMPGARWKVMCGTLTSISGRQRVR